MVNITFWGVRGSTPCPCDANRRYGGNTACVSLEAPGLDPIVLDLGTGLRFFGETPSPTSTFRGPALVTHLHWDHVQGLPFFAPINRPGARLDDLRPQPTTGIGRRGVRRVHAAAVLPGAGRPTSSATSRSTTSPTPTSSWGRAQVTVRDVPHVGATNGYRVEVDGVVDRLHQRPPAAASTATTIAAVGARAVPRRRPRDPRRAVRARTSSRVKSRLGPLHGRVRGAGGGRGRAPSAWRCSTTTRRTTTTPSTALLGRGPGACAEGTSVVEVVAASEGLTITLAGRRPPVRSRLTAVRARDRRPLA